MTVSQAKTPRIVVYASGRGSNFEAIADAVRTGRIRAEIAALVCDREEAPVIAKARARGIDAWVGLSESEQLARLGDLRADYLVLAGYMRILSPRFVQTMRGRGPVSRILNVHPSLLPEFPGKDGYGQAFRAGRASAGVTVHWVDEGVDTGPIVDQREFAIDDCRNADEVAARGIAIENEFYPAVLARVLAEGVPSAARLDVFARADLAEPRGERLMRAKVQAEPDLARKIRRLRVHESYAVRSAELSAEELNSAMRDAVLDSVLHERDSREYARSFRGLVFERSFLPGVTDNRGRTLGEALEIVTGRPLPRTQCRAGELFLVETRSAHEPLTREEESRLAGYFANPLIHRLSRPEIVADDRASAHRAFAEFPHVREKTPEARVLPLRAFSDDELARASRENTWALTPEEMRAIQAHFAGLGRDPTDVEIEVLAQTWSEHCKHKIFGAAIEYRGPMDGRGIPARTESLFKTTIAGATHASPKPWLISVFSDNAGIVKFSSEHAVCIKVETHNSPSALDPFGGAITGIVGVNRDILGCGLGAKPIFNTDVFCTGPLDHAGDLPERILHPRAVLEGVRFGVEAGGNQSGIPTVNGALVFDETYLGKPLVFCGTGGILPVRVAGRDCSDKTVLPGDLIVMVGGRIGKDGIHGATFSSEALTGASPMSAVQLGDPITQKRMADFLLEARDLGLYRSLTDNGAGGLSSSVGEMARISGGARLDVSRARTKYPGLAPFELVISESQERMTVALPPENRERFAALADRRGVELSWVGEFTKSGRFEIFMGDKPVADLGLDFLHDGCPRLELRAEWAGPKLPPTREMDDAWTELLPRLLSRPNIRSKESFIRQYDHEVQGRSVIKPLVTAGAGSSPNGAAVQRLDEESTTGIAIGCGILPELSRIDAYVMAQASVDEAVRNVLAVGGEYSDEDPEAVLALVDNFCWPDPVNDPGYAADLVRACYGLKDAATALRLPFVSGKDSMKNDYRGRWPSRNGEEPVKISVNPTLLVTALGRVPDYRYARTADFKRGGDRVYLLGPGDFSLVGSECSRMRGGAPAGSAIPRADWDRARRVYRWLGSEKSRVLKSAQDVSEGGLLVALAECGFARDVGVEIDADLGAPAELYGEGFHSFVVTVDPARAEELENEWARDRVPYRALGRTLDQPVFRLGGREIQLERLRRAWSEELL